MEIIRKAAAEFIGTFALTFVGGGAIIVTGGENLIAIALAHGLILAVMVSSVIHISGGQFNPAVSLALAAIGRQTPAQAVVLIVSQLLGAVAAAGLLNATLAPTFNVTVVNLGATLGEFTLGDAPRPFAALILEAIAAFFLMFVIMAVAVDAGRPASTPIAAGFAIGLTVAADILFFGPVTGASMNPARSFGPALVAWVWNAHWVYWAGPIIGALAAAIFYRVVFRTEPREGETAGS